MKAKLLLPLVLIILVLSSCKTNNVVSKGPIQWRKHRPGAHLNINTRKYDQHLSRTAQVENRNTFPFLPLKKIPLSTPSNEGIKARAFSATAYSDKKDCGGTNSSSTISGLSQRWMDYGKRHSKAKSKPQRIDEKPAAVVGFKIALITASICGALLILIGSSASLMFLGGVFCGLIVTQAFIDTYLIASLLLGALLYCSAVGAISLDLRISREYSQYKNSATKIQIMAFILGIGGAVMVGLAFLSLILYSISSVYG